MELPSLDALDEWDFPSNPFLPEWLLYSEDVSEDVQTYRLGACLVVVLGILLYQLCMVVFYLTSRISHTCLLKRSRRTLLPLLAVYPPMIYWLVGAKITLEILGPLAVFLLWLRYVSTWFSARKGASKSEADPALTEKLLEGDGKGSEASETSPPAEKRTTLQLFLMWSAMFIPLAGLMVYMAWFSECLSVWNPLLPACLWMLYVVAIANQNKFIGPEGKWRAALQSYIGFCLPDANRPCAPCAADSESAIEAIPEPKNKWKWFFHALIHFSIFMVLQQVQRTSCEANLKPTAAP